MVDFRIWRYLYFDIIRTGPEEGANKPECIIEIFQTWNILAEQIVYIGDSLYDIFSARQVGVVPIGAAWAESDDIVSIKNSAPDFIFYDVKEFYYWLKKQFYHELN